MKTLKDFYGKGMRNFFEKIFKEYYGEYSDGFRLLFINIPILTCLIFGMLKDYSIFLATLFKISLYTFNFIFFVYLFFLIVKLIDNVTGICDVDRD